MIWRILCESIKADTCYWNNKYITHWHYRKYTVWRKSLLPNGFIIQIVHSIVRLLIEQYSLLQSVLPFEYCALPLALQIHSESNPPTFPAWELWKYFCWRKHLAPSIVWEKNYIVCYFLENIIRRYSDFSLSNKVCKLSFDTDNGFCRGESKKTV